MASYSNVEGTRIFSMEIYIYIYIPGGVVANYSNVPDISFLRLIDIIVNGRFHKFDSNFEKLLYAFCGPPSVRI